MCSFDSILCHLNSVRFIPRNYRMTHSNRHNAYTAQFHSFCSLAKKTMTIKGPQRQNATLFNLKDPAYGRSLNFILALKDTLIISTKNTKIF